MNANEYDFLNREILPRVARCIPAPVEELSLAHRARFGVKGPHPKGRELRATVYWGSLYICEASIKNGVLVLHSWRPMYKDRGRLEFQLDEEPEGVCTECGHLPVKGACLCTPGEV